MSELWLARFHSFQDFVNKTKKYPQNNKNDKNEYELFCWAKNQRSLYSKNKLDQEKIKILKNCDIWYFDSKSKSSMLSKLQNNDSSNTIQTVNQSDTVKPVNENKHVVIDINCLNYYNYDETHEDIDFVNKKSTLEKVMNKIYNIFQYSNHDEYV